MAIRPHTVARTAAAATLLGVVAITTAATAWAAPFTTTADVSATTVYGDPTSTARFWQLQHFDDCAEMAAADVIGQVTGSEPSERGIVSVAGHTASTAHPGVVYSPGSDPDTGCGTSAADIPVLLARYRVDSVYTDLHHATVFNPTGIAALENDLAKGRGVIVFVNAETIWHELGDHRHADHALVVTGIDSGSGTVHLNDSGTPDGADERVSLSTFLDAWNTSDEAAVVTV